MVPSAQALGESGSSTGRASARAAASLEHPLDTAGFPAEHTFGDAA
jgi:hypothetical protein